MVQSFFWIVFAIGLSAAGSAGAQCALSSQIEPSQLASAAPNMRNFNALEECINGLAPSGTAGSVQYRGPERLEGINPLAGGEVIIGTNGAASKPQALTAGSGIKISAGDGSLRITLNGVGGGLYNQVLSEVPTTGNTGLASWFNQSSSALAENEAGISINAPASGDNNISGRYNAAPGAPYTITALIAATRNSTAYNSAGIGWYDGANKLHTVSYMLNAGGPARIVVSAWNNSTSWNHDDFTSENNFFSQPIWLQLSDDGLNVSFRFSQDGANFLTVFSAPKASAFLGSAGYANVIFFVNPQGGRAIGTLVSWRQS